MSGHFSQEEVFKLYSIALSELKKEHAYTSETDGCAIVKRRGNKVLITVVSSEPVDEDSYTQYMNHVILQVIYKDSGRFVRLVDIHEGTLHWQNEFKCSSCKYHQMY